MKPFDKRPGNYAYCQRCIMRLLEESPLPWSQDMLRSWYYVGIKHHALRRYIHLLLGAGRIWRCGPGLYTAISNQGRRLNYKHISTSIPIRRPKVIVSDDMLARFGFNL